MLNLVTRPLDHVLWVGAFAQHEQLEVEVVVVEEEVVVVVVVVTQQQRQPSTRIRFSNMLYPR